MSAAEELGALRTQIEALDAELIRVIAARLALAREVGRVKAKTGQAISDPAREATVVQRATLLAREAGLPEEDIRTLFWQIMAMSRREQRALG